MSSSHLRKESMTRVLDARSVSSSASALLVASTLMTVEAATDDMCREEPPPTKQLQGPTASLADTREEEREEIEWRGEEEKLPPAGEQACGRSCSA